MGSSYQWTVGSRPCSRSPINSGVTREPEASTDRPCFVPADESRFRSRWRPVYGVVDMNQRLDDTDPALDDRVVFRTGSGSFVNSECCRSISIKAAWSNTAQNGVRPSRSTQ